MATAINSPRASGDKVELEIGVPRILTLLYNKPRETQFSLMFSTEQGALFIPTAEASDFEHDLAALRVGRGDSIRVTKVKHGGRGGGFTYRVERAEGAPSDRDYCNQLEQSVRNAHAAKHGAATVSDAGLPVSDTIAANAMCAAMCSAVDAIVETQAYAARKGLGVTFSEESVRAIGLSIYIDGRRSGSR